MKYKLFFFLFYFLFSLKGNTQCAMCRAVLESEEGQSTAKGINDGIMYLMAVPYLLVAGIAFMIYWKYFREKKENK
jgi:heme/copper-type cytochrome/quinol oxidase subunit 2